MDHICYDILFHICEYLDLTDIINVRFISTQFDDVYNDNLLWKMHYIRNYNIKHKDLYKLSAQINYKNLYKKCHDLNVLKHNFKMNEFIIDIMNLQELGLFNKNIIKISPKIKHLIELRIFDISYNEITKIPILRKDL